jgi:hypothetical protein
VKDPKWTVQTTAQFDRDFKKLDKPVQRRIMSYLEDIEILDDPRLHGKGLTANHVGIAGSEPRTQTAQLHLDSFLIRAEIDAAIALSGEDDSAKAAVIAGRRYLIQHDEEW